jgi:uncharacterized protein (DUF427 family)
MDQYKLHAQEVAREDRDAGADLPERRDTMTLTIGTGPFGNQSAGTFNFDTGALKPHTLYFEDSPRRVRVAFGGEIVADSKRAKLMHETGLLPIYYFPQEDVRSELLEKSDHTTHCPFKGDASYWSVKAGEHVAENAVWSFPEPLEDAPPLAGYVAFCWKKMDTLFLSY